MIFDTGNGNQEKLKIKNQQQTYSAIDRDEQPRSHTMLDSSQRATAFNDTYQVADATSELQHSAVTRTSLDLHTAVNVTTSIRNASRLILEHIAPPSPLAQSTLSLLTWPAVVGGNSNTTTMTLNSLTPTSFALPNASSSSNYSFAGPTSTNPNATYLDEDNDVLRTIEYIGAVLSFYYVPIIVCTGSLGNILSVAVFFKTKLRKLSSSIYLGALAVSDTCFLLGIFAQWLNFIDINIYNREYFCQFFTYFSNLACFCSNWFVVAFTVERFIAVMYPLKRQTMCTVRRAKIVLVCLTLLGCMHCAPFLVSSTPVYSPKAEMTICDIKSEYKDYITLLNYWDTVVVFAVPFTTIAVLNTFTGFTVWKFATVRRALTMQKIKTQHLPLTQHHEMIVSTPLTSNCDTTTVSTATTANQQQQGGASATYRVTTIATTSLKRLKSNCCAATTHLNGHERSPAAAGAGAAAPGDPHLSHKERGSMKNHQYSRPHHNYNTNHSHQQHSHRHFTMGQKNCCTCATCSDTSRKSVCDDAV